MEAFLRLNLTFIAGLMFVSPLPGLFLCLNSNPPFRLHSLPLARLQDAAPKRETNALWGPRGGLNCFAPSALGLSRRANLRGSRSHFRKRQRHPQGTKHAVRSITVLLLPGIVKLSGYAGHDDFERKKQTTA
jgi:hypothetical protein